MKSYLSKIKHEEHNSLSVCFYIEQSKIMDIGGNLHKINEMAYMNGYNWEALLMAYLKMKHPSVLEGMGCDPEAGMFVAYYTLNEENERKADELIEIIGHLIEHETLLYTFVKENGKTIEWD